MQPLVNRTLSLSLAWWPLSLGRGLCPKPVLWEPTLEASGWATTHGHRTQEPSGSAYWSLRPFLTMFWESETLEFSTQTALSPLQGRYGLLGGYSLKSRGSPEPVICGLIVWMTLRCASWVSTLMCVRPLAVQEGPRVRRKEDHCGPGISTVLAQLPMLPSLLGVSWHWAESSTDPLNG